MRRQAIRWHAEAVEEAREARAWYAERSPGAADGFIAELDAAVDRVTDNPGRFGRYLHGTRYTRLGRFPYLLVFRELKATVQIVAVAHGSRKPRYWRDR